MFDVSADTHFNLSQFLLRYVRFADNKDPAGAAAHLDGITVTFPTAQAHTADELHHLFTGLWSSPTPHRHDVFNLTTNRVDDSSVELTAHYQKWLYPEGQVPFVDALGNYRLTATLTDRSVSVVSLTVKREWTKN